MANVDKLTGQEVQGWLLGESIGRGADGVVYAGKKDGRDAAVKVFFPDALEKNGLEASRERLELQLTLVGKKHHDNLVEIYEGGEFAELETLFIVMEFVPGKSLDKLVGKIPLDSVPSLAAQLASAAEFLEEKELVHRDIKPANVVVSDDFKKLTLLDLGIVYQVVTADDDQGRLSGKEFVATLRYSPPEFVWRTEQEGVDGAWRAVTFYQIGATLHDMIMGKLLFSGYDLPRACLYDCVRDRTPVIESSEVSASLIQTVQACLLKDWRQRLQFVSWPDFTDLGNGADSQQQEKRIRLRQVRGEESRQAIARQKSVVPQQTREQLLWYLNSALILQVRTYVMNNPIFPKCRVLEHVVSEREYVTAFEFDPDPALSFPPSVIFNVRLSADSLVEAATKISFTAARQERELGSSVWTEMFSVDAAFTVCQKSFLDAVESLLST